MSFKKYNEMELAMLASIATMTEYTAHRIARENGDLTPVVDEDCISAPEFSYLNKPNAVRHASRRKETFKKKAERKELAQKLGYNVGTEYNNKKVRDLLSSNHMDRTYLRGEKADKKYLTVQKEKAIMEREAVEEARDAMEKEHDGILGAIAQDIDTLTLDMRDNEYFIERLEEEYKDIEAAMELVAEKLKNAQLRKNGVFAALRQKEEEYKETNDKLMQEMHRFGW